MTRLELNAEVIVTIIIIIIIITVILRKVQTKKNTKEVRGFESASPRLLVKHYTTELPQCVEIVAPI
jgi:hypothetical protein